MLVETIISRILNSFFWIRIFLLYSRSFAIFFSLFLNYLNYFDAFTKKFLVGDSINKIRSNNR